MLNIKNFQNSKINNANAYVIYDNDLHQAIIIDLANEVQEINEFITSNNLEVTDVFFTHGHWDHIKNLDKLICFKSANIWIGKDDEMALFDSNINYSSKRDILNSWNLDPKIKNEINIELIEGEFAIDLFNNKITMSIFNVGGHTPGTTLYYIDDFMWLFTGDTVFEKSIGFRFLDNYDDKKFKETLKKIWEEFPGCSKIFPGHHNSNFELSDLKNNDEFIENL